MPLTRRRGRASLGKLLAQLSNLPGTPTLWLLDPWPWTPDSEGRFDDARPVWATTRIGIESLVGLSHLAPADAVRELNHRLDPWRGTPVEAPPREKKR